MIYLTEDLIHRYHSLCSSCRREKKRKKLSTDRSSVHCEYNFLTLVSIERYLFFIAAWFDWSRCEPVGIGEQIFESGSKSKSSLLVRRVMSAVALICALRKGARGSLTQSSIEQSSCLTALLTVFCQIVVNQPIIFHFSAQEIEFMSQKAIFILFWNKSLRLMGICWCRSEGSLLILLFCVWNH